MTNPTTLLPNKKQSLTPKELGMIVLGTAMFVVSVNVFVVPIGLYNSGVVGLAQIIRTLVIRTTGFNSNFDIAGLINFCLNLPLFFIAYKHLSKKLFYGTVLSLIIQTIGFSLIPIPTSPILSDYMASCAIGGIMGGVGCGLILMNGATGGGVDILGVFFSQKYKNFSVGKLGIAVNAVIYTMCAILFNVQTAIYSIIYVAIYSVAMDRVHYQNIEVYVMIFTKNPEIKQEILHKFVRGVTYWKGLGAYTDTETEVLVTIVSKYELAQIKKYIVKKDPHAFIIVNEGAKVTGGYEKRLV